MRVRIEIDTKTFVRFWLVVIGFAFAILALYSARTALFIIGTALFLALALNGPVSKLASKLPHRSRVLSTALAFIAVIGFLAAIIFLVVPPIVQQTLKFVDNAPQMIETMSSQWHVAGDVINKYNLQPQIDASINSAKDNMGRILTGFSQNIISGVSSALFVFTSTLLILIFTFLMLVEGPMWVNRVWRLYQDKDRMEHDRDILRKMHIVVSNYVVGQLAVSGIGALCSGGVVFILSFFFKEIPANLALPTIGIAFVFALIPMFGATIAGIIISLLLAINSVPAAIIFVIYFLIYQQVENNVISPTIQSKRIDLSPLAVLTAVTIGLYVLGIAGGIISIPIAGSIKVLMDDYLDRSRAKRESSEKPLAKLVKKLKDADA